LRIGTGTVELAPNRMVSTLTYNGQFPGPLLSFKVATNQQVPTKFTDTSPWPIRGAAKSMDTSRHNSGIQPHLRTTNPIESTFATVRYRTQVTKGHGSRQAGITMAFS
jgi:hypothetical protein